MIKLFSCPEIGKFTVNRDQILLVSRRFKNGIWNFHMRQKMLSLNPCKTRIKCILENSKNSSMDGEDLWWSSLISCCVVDHHGWQPLPKITKTITVIIPFSLKACNKNETPLSSGQSSTSTCCWPSWKATKNYIEGVQHRETCNNNEAPIILG